MKQQIFVIHGGNASNSYAEYLKYLKTKKVDLKWLAAKDWKTELGKNLGQRFQVYNPQMPNKQNAKYLEWKIYFEKFIPLMSDQIILIGHSLGGIFLAKYLSEKKFPKKILATFLIAAPFNTPTKHPLADFNLLNDLSKLAIQGGQIYFYHSEDDRVVPFSNLKHYKKLLPSAMIRTFKKRGHFNESNFPELTKDLKNLLKP
ncbi:alpha/beta hydrolase [Candidatus Peregrinibacteria bacterium]|nr:alpha/beta hydrolase [Candidatus Peregrinibacteria bacterium]